MSLHSRQAMCNILVKHHMHHKEYSKESLSASARCNHALLSMNNPHTTERRKHDNDLGSSQDDLQCSAAEYKAYENAETY